jgi:hypothetical protein
MQIQNNHIRWLPKKIRDLESIRRALEKSIALLTKEHDEINRCQKETYEMLLEEAATNLQRKGKKKELDEINRCQKETYGMLMEEAATNLQRKKRKRGQTTITNKMMDN